jgi:hypothetical protein
MASRRCGHFGGLPLLEATAGVLALVPLALAIRFVQLRVAARLW